MNRASIDACETYLRLLKLSMGASDEEIRAAITSQRRLWRRRQGATTLEVRHEAERMVQTLETAEDVLLGAEGKVSRARLGQGTSGRSVVGDIPDISAGDAASKIEAVLRALGTFSQRRTRGVVERRSALFHEGFEFVMEETIHKAYEREKDSKRSYALQGNAVVCDVIDGGVSSLGDISVRTWLPGAWVNSLCALAATLPAKESS